jgi:two-component system response regulator FlrC
MTQNRNILIIENDPQERAMLARTLEQWGYAPTGVSSGEEGLRELASGPFTLVIAGFDVPGLDASALLQQAGADGEDAAEVLFVSSTAPVEVAVEMMKAGALDFIIRPLDPEQLNHHVQRVFEAAAGEEASERGRRKRGGTRIVAEDPGMVKLLDLARQVADSRASVLIQGESGTGKELVARYIHENSGRRQGPFVAVNCAALPETLLESELFGHEKGAFTGAVSSKPGKFELAGGGTILLDEVTEMPLHLQSKFLRVLQEREIDRVGGRRPIQVDIRVIATTNRDMKETLEKKEFREDLYYRLNVIPLRLPSLRRRAGDIPVLARHFIEKYNDLDGRSVKDLSPSAVEKLTSLPLRGNVRELENIIERAVLLCDGETIRPEDLLCDDALAGGGADGEMAADPVTPGEFASRQLKDVEKTLIFQTLDETNGNRTHAAKILGISVRTLRNKLNEYRESIDA